LCAEFPEALNIVAASFVWEGKCVTVHEREGKGREGKGREGKGREGKLATDEHR